MSYPSFPFARGEVSEENLNDNIESKLVSKIEDSSQIDNKLLDSIICPQDSYENGIYWADLSCRKRYKFAVNQFSTVSRAELKQFGRDFLSDPLKPLRDYFSHYVVSGMGMFTEGYTLFSIGNNMGLFKTVWPQCWKNHTVCTKSSMSAVTYLEILGIIMGQVFVGLLGDYMGRRWGLIQDAAIMFLGTVILTASWGVTLQGWVFCYAISLFIYGLGVGGEYPMTSTSVIEGKYAQNRSVDKLHRGRNVVLAFLMQGWGQFVNQALLLLFLAIFNHTTKELISIRAAQITFRLSFGFIALLTLWLLYYRIYKINYNKPVLANGKRAYGTTGYSIKKMKLCWGHYWHRLVGTAGTWFCNDFFFYGNKLFQSNFIKVISPEGDLSVNWTWNLVNISCSMMGYYLAAILIDHKLVGRKRMQGFGFIMDFILFLISAAVFNELIKVGFRIKIFMAIYFISSFFVQFGPNCTTFLVAAEGFPAQIRSSAHGFAAAIGKLGALVPSIIYNYMSDHAIFWLVCWFGLLGALLTYAFVPDSTGLDMKEQERYWNFVLSGRENEYCGVAINKQHLSWYEIFVLKRHKRYDPVKDMKMKKEELRNYFDSHFKGTQDINFNSNQGDDFSDEVYEHFKKKIETGSGSNSPSSGEKRIFNDKFAGN